MGIWATRSPLKIHCYTCMSFKTYWSRLIHTKLSSHRSFVINMYVVTMSWRCISPWSFHRWPQRRREMYIFRYISRFPCILSKNKQKKEEEKLRLNTCKHWEFESRNRNLSAVVIHVKPSRRKSNLDDSRKPSRSEDFELLSILAVQQMEQGFHHNQFPKIQLFSGSLSCARTLYWFWALRFISLDSKML